MWLSCAGYVRLQTSLGELNLELHCDMVNTSLSSPSLMFLALTSHTTHPHTPHQSHSTPVTLHTSHTIHSASTCCSAPLPWLLPLCRFLWPVRISSATVRMVTMTTQSSTAPFVISWYTVVKGLMTDPLPSGGWTEGVASLAVCLTASLCSSPRSREGTRLAVDEVRECVWLHQAFFVALTVLDSAIL